MDLLPPKPKYNPLRNESLSSLEEGASGSSPPEEPPSPSTSSLGPILPPPPGVESPTTLCSFFPRMSHLKLANPAGGRPGAKGEPARAPADGEGPAGAAPRDSGPLPPLQDMNKLSGGGGRRTRVEGGQLGGEEWTRHGSFVNKPTRGWLHPNDKVMGPGVSYLVRVSEPPPPAPSHMPGSLAPCWLSPVLCTLGCQAPWAPPLPVFPSQPCLCPFPLTSHRIRRHAEHNGQH